MLKKYFFGILILIFTAIFGFICWFYLVGLNLIIKSDFFITNIKNISSNLLQMDLDIKNPNIKTSIKPIIDLSVDKLILSKNSIVLVELENFHSSVSFNRILRKEIKLNKLIADTLTIKADKLIEVIPVFAAQSESSDFKVDFYNADIKLNNLDLSYNLNKTNIEVYAKDIFIDYDNEYKNLGFNLEVLIKKNNKLYADIIATTIDEIRLYDDRLQVSDFKFLINDSRLKVSAEIDKKGLNADIVSDKFYLADIFNLVNCDIAIENGEELLKPLTNPEGNISFSFNLKNEDLKGTIIVNNTKAKLKDLSYIPLNIIKGKIIVTPDKINFVDLIGYWGKNKKNNLKIYGDIKDYYKTFDSNITIDTVIANEFFKDYLARLINNTTLFVSKPVGTRIIYKAKNNIMDITWLAKISKGINFGISNEKSALSDYDRAVKGDFHIEGDSLDIKNINYYIANDIRKGVKLTPILVLDAKMDLLGNIDSIGFSFGREMSSEFLNIFASEQLLKKGTIKGNLHIDYRNNIPCLKADMILKNTFAPQQRIFIKEAILKTDSNLINFDIKGRFKRANYDFQGKIKNELQPPFVIKNMALSLDNVDVERFLTAVNTTNTEASPSVVNSEDDIADDNYMFDTNLIRIEEADFTLDKGNYKELTFSNIKAKLTLDDKGVMRIQSNKFNIAQGISTLKVECDLKNLKHYVRLGVKDVDSNLMAKVLFNLDKEIQGKASGLIELNTDKTMKMNGSIKFLVNEGTIGKIGLVEYALKIASVFRNPVAMISPAAIIDIVSIPEGKFDKIQGELRIKDNVVSKINIQSYSKSLSALIRGRFDLEKHDTSLRIYTRFSSDKKSVFGFLRNISLNTLANKVQLNSKNDANYYAAELVDLPQIDVAEEKTQIFLTQVEGDVEHNNFLSSLKKIK